MKLEAKGKGDDSDWLTVVKAKVESLRYGLVQVVVHDSRVVQIEKTERLRLDDAEQLSLAHERKGRNQVLHHSKSR